MAVLDTEKYLDAVCRMIDEGQTDVPVPIRGDSMRPFLRNADFAYLAALPEKVKKGDMILFRRANGQYVLHRVYKILPEGQYLMLGDSQMIPEPVSGQQFRALVVHVKAGAQLLTPKDFRWWFFAYPWRWLARWRPQVARLVNRLRRQSTPAR